MFGHHWEPAQATIVATHIKKTTGDGDVSIREFAADIVPASGTPFRTLLQEPTIATDFWPPSVGDVVRVQADVGRQKAKFDKSDPNISHKARKAAIEAQFQSTLTQPASGVQPLSVQERAAGAAERLAQLERLKAQGVLTDAEYEAQRRAIIGTL
jgi:hypothetical protein